MQIQLEAHETHTITGYSDTEITINKISYTEPLILSSEQLITPWDIQSDFLKPIFELAPEVIIIGTNTPTASQRTEALKQSIEHRIGIELMTLGAACRTFNILLGEQRRVVAGLILNR